MMNKNLTKKRKKGFTLIELIVVIAILGVLAAVAIPRFASKTEEAKKAADMSTASNIAMAIKAEIAEGDIKTTDKTLPSDFWTNNFDGKTPVSQTTGEVFDVSLANGIPTITSTKDEKSYTFYPEYAKPTE